MGPNPVTGVLIRRKKFGHREKWDKVLSEAVKVAAEIGGMEPQARVAANHLKQGKCKEGFF